MLWVLLKEKFSILWWLIMNRKELLKQKAFIEKQLKALEENEELFFGKYTFNNIEKALEDEDSDIRLQAYRALGFSEKALKDKYWFIRLQAYRVLGFSEKALKDEYWFIRLEAQKYFKIKNALKKGFEK